MHHQQNQPNPVPASSPESATRATPATPSPFQRSRSLATQSFARRRTSTSEQDDLAPKKRKLSTAANTVDGDPATGNINGRRADAHPSEPARRSLTVDHRSLPEKNPKLHDYGRYYGTRDDINDPYLSDDLMYGSNIISIRLLDMLSRLQSSLYGPGDIDLPTEDQNERMDIILDLSIKINEARNNIPMVKTILLQKMRTLSHDRPFQNALFQVYNACMGHQNQTLRLGGPSSKLTSSTGLPNSKSL